METAIQFAEWLQANGYEMYDEVGKWISPTESLHVCTTKQLAKIFDDQKKGEGKPASGWIPIAPDEAPNLPLMSGLDNQVTEDVLLRGHEYGKTEERCVVGYYNAELAIWEIYEEGVDFHPTAYQIIKLYESSLPTWIPVEQGKDPELPRDEELPEDSIKVLLKDSDDFYTGYYNYKLKAWFDDSSDKVEPTYYQIINL